MKKNNVEEDRLTRMECIRKVEEIVDYVMNNREDVITRKAFSWESESVRVNVSFCGKIGPDVSFSGRRGAIPLEEINNLRKGFTNINMKYLNDANQYLPLCNIHIIRNRGNTALGRIIDFIPYYNHDFVNNSTDLYYRNRPDFQNDEVGTIMKIRKPGNVVEGCSLHIYGFGREGKDDVINNINNIYNIVNMSKQKATNVQKLSKLNIHSTADLINTRDNGQER